MSNRIFTFKSGYTVGIKPNYTRKMLELTLNAWIEANQAPEPPTEEVPVRGGTRPRALINDRGYQNDLALWNFRQEVFARDAKMSLAIDPDSLDEEAIKAARKYYEEAGLIIPANDILLYLSVVADRGSGTLAPEIAAIQQAILWAQQYAKDNGAPLLAAETIKTLQAVVDANSGGPDDIEYREDEWTALGRFIDKETGPSAALIEHILRATFRKNGMEEHPNMGVSAPAKEKRKAEAKSA